MIWSCHMPSLNLFHTLSPVMHIQGCAAADLHHDSFENKQMLLTVQQALKNRNGWERLRCEDIVPLIPWCQPVLCCEAGAVAKKELRGCGTCAPLTAALQLRSLQCTVRYSRLQFKDRLRFCTENIRDWKMN